MLKPIKDIIIPIIQESKNGYYEIYPDKKVWHEEGVVKERPRDVFEQELVVDIIKEESNNMINPILSGFQEKKKSESAFITLSDDGEKVSGIVKEIKSLSKVGFAGKEVEVIRLEIETADGVKSFDKGTKKWVDELVNKKVDVGTKISIVRHGKKDSKDTWYEIIVNK